MRTLDLKQAAAFLKMNPETLRLLAAAKKIPAARPSRRWCFMEEDLAEYLRSLYDPSCKVSQGDNLRGELLCHSVNVKMFGGYGLVMEEDEYNKALELPTK
jgi:excisionase family DNA binding protein